MTTPFVPAPNVLQVELVQNNDFQFVENVVHYLGTAAWTKTMADAITTQLQSWWSTNIAPLTSVNSNLANLIATDLTSQTALRVVYTPTPPPQGTATGAAAPNNVTFALKKETYQRGRSLRGRLYACALPLSAVTNDQMTTTARTAWLNALNLAAFLSPATNGAKLVIVSRRTNNAWRSTALVTQVLGFTAVDANLDSQRRRLTGHNRHR